MKSLYNSLPNGLRSLCLLFFTLQFGVQSWSQLTCNDFVILALDNDCFNTIDADQILEGGPYCYPCMLVQLDKTPGAPDCNGPWVLNTVDASDIGQTYCVRVTDPGNGNFCQGSIQIVDNLPPNLSCPSNSTVGMDATTCFHTAANGEFDPSIISDNCYTPTLTYNLFSITSGTNGSGSNSIDGVSFNRGLTQVKWTAVDGSSNSATCTFTVQVDDQQPPSIACPGNMTLDTDLGQCTYTVQGTELDPDSWSENCPLGLAWSLSGANNDGGNNTLAGYVMQPGLTTVTWTLIENYTFNIVSCSFDVQIDDNEPPGIACPVNQTRSTDQGQCNYATLNSEFDPTSVDDNCQVATLTYSLTGATNGIGTNSLSGKIFNKGMTTVGWIAQDSSSNPGTCSFNILIEENEPPVFPTCNGDIKTVNMTFDCKITIPNLLNTTAATDNCFGVTKTQSPMAGLVMTATHNEIIPITITAKDASNNTAVCQQFLKALDVTLPIINSCPRSRVIYPNASCEIEIPDLIPELTGSDCSLPLTMTQNPAAGTILLSEVGLVNTVTMTVTDDAGNSKGCNVSLLTGIRYFAYIANSNSISVVNTGTNIVETTIPVGNKPVMAAATGSATNPTANRLYVVNSNSNSVSVINTNTHSVIATIGVGDNPVAAATGSATNPTANRIYIVNSNSNSVSVINPMTNSVEATIAVGGKPVAAATGSATNPTANRIYVVNSNSNSVSVINPLTNSVETTIAVGDKPVAVLAGMQADPMANRIYVVNSNSNSVSVINPFTNSLEATIAVGDKPVDVEMRCATNPKANRIYVANFTSNSISVINPFTNTLETTIPVGTNPVRLMKSGGAGGQGSGPNPHQIQQIQQVHRQTVFM
ncbi:MAG: HYR domain-containing protein [Lewinellaceae bacterium]|nr:HYR domain-containing protein [Lewinellaceae bacterium]